MNPQSKVEQHLPKGCVKEPQSKEISTLLIVFLSGNNR